MIQPQCAAVCFPCQDCCQCEGPTIVRQLHLRHVAWLLTGFTILWNIIEASIALTSGIAAGSASLVGFGLDSLVETASAAIVAWRLTQTERAERMAVRLIALSFFGIAAYVVAKSIAQLLGASEQPEQSPVGLVLVALSLLVMPLLARAKARVATRLGSVTLQADAAETRVCFYLSAAVLVGLAANVAAGWWWMDPAAGLVVAAVALYEGQRAWARGELCAEGGRKICSTDCCETCPLA